MSSLVLLHISAHYSQLQTDVCNSLHILHTLIATKELVHFLNSDSLGLRDEEIDPHSEEETETWGISW